MKIFLRISNLSNGGAEKVLLSLAKELKEKCEVAIVVDSKLGGNYDIALQYGIRVISFDVDRTYKTIFPFARLIKKEKPDVIFSALTDTNAAAIISKFLSFTKSKVVVSEHAAVIAHWAAKPLAKKIILWSYLIFFYRFCANVICVSKGLEYEIFKYTRLRNLLTVYNPIRQLATSNIKTEESTETFKILSVGRVTRQKDLLCALSAAALLKNHGLKFKWDFVGSFDDVSYKAELDFFVKNNRLENYIEFTNFTSDINFFYARSDVFILSSAWEGFGNVIVEAMQFGVDIISTDCNYGPSEILENGRYGYLVPVGDYAAIAEKVVNIKNNGGFDSCLLRQRASEFSEERVGKIYFDLFKKIQNT